MQKQVNHLAALCLQQKGPAVWVLLPHPHFAASFRSLFQHLSLAFACSASSGPTRTEARFLSSC